MSGTWKTIISKRMLCELLSLLCVTLLPACNGRTARTGSVTVTTPAESVAGPRFVQKSIQFVSPAKHDTCRFHQEIRIAYANNKRYPVDSAHVLYNNARVATLDSTTREFLFKIPPDKCGVNNLKIIAFHPKDRQGSIVQPIVVKPDKAPRRMGFEIVKVYPHDISASTQGLVYHEGYLYEGTGIQGESTLRKIDLVNNRQLDMFSLSSEYFGEGITIYNGKIYQITWTSRKGFVYDLETFRQESTFDYTTQGWGITTMHDLLVMSDGTHQLFHLAPAGFNKIKTVEVYDHHGPVHSLNELEWINGYIWANVWLTDRIVVIDPHSGAVVEELYLPNMLSPAEKVKLNAKEDVLNGIAYNAGKGTVLVTGKHWPKLFELKIK
jgi:glutamine cyclotransferase